MSVLSWGKKAGHWNLKLPFVKPFTWNSLLNSIVNNEDNSPYQKKDLCSHLLFLTNGGGGALWPGRPISFEDF